MPGDLLPSPNPQDHFRLQAALRESEILRELAELLASSLDLERILQVLVKRSTQVCEVERCAVWLLEDARGMFILKPTTCPPNCSIIKRYKRPMLSGTAVRCPLMTRSSTGCSRSRACFTLKICARNQACDV